MSVQARGCMTTAVHLRTDRRREQQLQLAAYLAEAGSEVTGFGDTRLGDDASVMEGLTRRAICKQQAAMLRLERERDDCNLDCNVTADGSNREPQPTANVGGNTGGHLLGGDKSTISIEATSSGLGMIGSGRHPIPTSNGNPTVTAKQSKPASNQRRKQPKVNWISAGSGKDKNDAWRGGVALASVGDAAMRQQQEITDCRGWGRYLGRIYRGKNKI